MKFSKIASIVKKSKTAILITDADGMQWLSNGAAAYRLENMPTLDEDTVLTIMNVSDDARDKWYTAMRETKDSLYQDFAEGEEEITAEDAGITIIHNGKLLTPIYTIEGMLWVDAALLAPTEKKDMEYRTFFVRKSGGHRAIAVKDGMILIAVIMELNAWDDTSLSDGLKNLLERCRAEEFRRLELKAAEELPDHEMDFTEGEEEHDTEE